MKKLVDNYTSEQLREALTKRLEAERESETKEGEIDRQNMLSFLLGKKFLLERHPNENCIDLYEVDVTHAPIIEEEKWVKIKIISHLKLAYSSVKIENDWRVDDEITVRSTLSYSFYDDFSPEFNRQERKYKSFHPNNKVESIDESTYKGLFMAWETTQEIIEEQFNKLK